MENGSARATMTEFWQEHSEQATVEEMMLDSNARIISREELGAGIGRYTQHLVKVASQVTAVDFMQKFLDKNKEDNGHHGNAEFIQADATQLDFPENSFDLVFSNWLFMYLSDTELLSLAGRMLDWLSPGGYLFFRESCFHQSGDNNRSFNPTLYRSPSQYNHLLTSVVRDDPASGASQGSGFEIVMNKSVQTYIKMKKNQNQLCWLLQKVRRNCSANQGFATFQQFLDSQQYSCRGILRYEKIFGRGFISTGGARTTEEFVDMLALLPGQRVLDVGCGIGGGDFYMARKFGASVLGIDLSSNMVEIAMERSVEENLPSVQFEVGDATRRLFPECSFDVVYSRDTILHIADKLALFKQFYSWLKPGGKLLISDYCCGEKPWTPAFQDYVKQRGYILYTPPPVRQGRRTWRRRSLLHSWRRRGLGVSGRRIGPPSLSRSSRRSCREQRHYERSSFRSSLKRITATLCRAGGRSCNAVSRGTRDGDCSTLSDSETEKYKQC
ncbi:phosphoethanolamine N-methyltransferase 3 isoform X2 [Huso huso]|uniref:phosphoethanolamine N-methyltransferase n=1 Tax=Huso huso TaxID=61971 RepID=A0ABR0Y103_HUSHU